MQGVRSGGEAAGKLAGSLRRRRVLVFAAGRHLSDVMLGPPMVALQLGPL